MSLIQSSPDYQLSSSLRARPAKESLILAKKIARERGVSRVVNTTWLDRIGVPVFASIRPDGIKGTLCVHSGKGFSADEAEIGAYMEAIEISFGRPVEISLHGSWLALRRSFQLLKGRYGLRILRPGKVERSRPRIVSQRLKGPKFYQVSAK